MTQEKRTINANSYIQQYLGLPVDGVRYTITKGNLELLLKTYGKELLLEATERAEVEEEWEFLGEEAGDVRTYHVNQSTILQLIDEL